MNDVETYTLAKITSLLCPDCDEQKAYRVSRRIQNLVSSKLILPLKDGQTGRGVQRQYDRYEIYKARTLLELGQFQIPTSVLELVATLFNDLNPDRDSELRRESAGKRKLREKLRSCMTDAIDNKDTILLLINSVKTIRPAATLVRAKEIKPVWTSAITLNLTEIIQSVK
jgi:hypothetical protein